MVVVSRLFFFMLAVASVVLHKEEKFELNASLFREIYTRLFIMININLNMEEVNKVYLKIMDFILYVLYVI